MARLSICVPTYNRAALLRQTLHCLCDQGLAREDYVVLISDNASQDETSAAVHAFSDRLSIRYHRNPENIGLQRNIQQALDMSETPFLALLPDDDLVAPGHFGRALNALEAHPNAVLMASLAVMQEYPGMLGTMFFRGLPKANKETSFSVPYVWEQAEWLGVSLTNTPVILIGTVFKAEAYRRCERWRRYLIWGDRLLLAEMGLYGDVITLPWIAGYYRTGPHQNNGLHGDRRAEFQEVTTEVLRLCEHHKIPVLDFWSQQLVRSAPGHRSKYLDELKFALPAGLVQEISDDAERLLGSKIRAGGRLEQLGLPHNVAEFIRAGRNLFSSR